MKHRVRQKNCQLCEQTLAVLYRIKYQPAEDWVFVCPTCWTSLSKDNAQ